MIFIREVRKRTLHPVFGKALIYSVDELREKDALPWDIPESSKAYGPLKVALVRRDLPPAAKKFVKLHECYHLGDKRQNVLAREVKANFYAALRHPWGLLVTAALSLSPERLRFYQKRIRGGR